MALANLLCAILPRVARENRTDKETKHRSAEGSTCQLRKP